MADEDYSAVIPLFENNDNKTLIDFFLKTVEQNKGKIFLTQPGVNGRVITFTYGEVLRQALKMAGYLTSLKLPPKSQIAICSRTCSYWFMADLAILMAGHVSVPIFSELTYDTVSYTLKHSESKFLFIGKMMPEAYEEMKNAFTGIPSVSFPLCPAPDCASETTWDAIIDDPKIVPLATPVKRDPDEMATIIYTSGSTGKPKGVMTSFRAMLDATKGIVSELKVTPNDRYLSYLPVAHGMERWVGECVPMYSGEQIFYAESISTFADDLQRCKPTIFLSVPRLWTKMQAKIFAKLPEKKLNFYFKIPCLGSLIKRKVLKKLGLDKVRVAGSGSAPLPPDLMGWYRNLDLELNEGYGMTENFNYSHMAMVGRSKLGFVGEPHIGVNCRINESDGEIQVKTPGKMMGYYKDPKATAEAFTEDGWVRTGDKGTQEEYKGKQMLKITGRTKEIFKTSKGKYVAPAPIENLLNSSSLIELSMVTGRGMPQPLAIVQLSEVPKQKAMSSAAMRLQFTKELDTHLKTKVNAVLDGPEQLCIIVIVIADWLPENGFLTPTMKIKRAVIEDAYAKHYDSWYNNKQKTTNVVWHGFDDGDETKGFRSGEEETALPSSVPANIVTTTAAAEAEEDDGYGVEIAV